MPILMATLIILEVLVSPIHVATPIMLEVFSAYQHSSHRSFNLRVWLTLPETCICSAIQILVLVAR